MYQRHNFILLFKFNSSSTKTMKLSKKICKRLKQIVLKLLSYHIYLKSTQVSFTSFNFQEYNFVCDYNDESFETKAKIC